MSHGTKTRLLVLLPTFLLSCLMLGIRSRSSADRFPADPGYDYVLSAHVSGVRSWFNLDPYLHIGAHFVSWVINFFPLDRQAIAMSSAVHLIWALTGCGLLFVLQKDQRSPWIQVAGVLALVLCPAAAESALGNVGNLKWPLITLAVLVASSSEVYAHPRAWSVFFVLTGLTNPLIPLISVPLLLQYWKCGPTERRALRVPIAAVMLTLVIQVSVVGLRGVSQGRGGSRIYEPWPGMGLFWWFGMLSPTVICLLYLSVSNLTRILRKDQFLTRTAIGSIVLAVASIAYGGIGDRYFVAPMILSWIILAAAAEEIAMRFGMKLRLALAVFTLLILAVPSIKWFGSSWYLTSGPRWSAEIKSAKDQCKQGTDVVTIQVGTDNMTQLTCSYILSRS